MVVFGETEQRDLSGIQTDDEMKRERALQVVLVVLGVFYCFLGVLPV